MHSTFFCLVQLVQQPEEGQALHLLQRQLRTLLLHHKRHEVGEDATAHTVRDGGVEERDLVPLQLENIDGEEAVAAVRHHHDRLAVGIHLEAGEVAVGQREGDGSQHIGGLREAVGQDSGFQKTHIRFREDGGNLQ